MFPTVHGYRIRFTVLTHVDALVVPFPGIEDEHQAITVALDAAREGYPDGAITITHIETGRWCPTGGWANPAHTAQYTT